MRGCLVTKSHLYDGIFMKTKKIKFVAPSLINNYKSLWLWAPLLFSIFYFLPIIFNSDHFSISMITGALAIYSVFLYFYMKGQFSSEQNVLLPIVAILLLSFFGTYFNPGTFTLFAFATFLIGYYFPVPKSIIGLFITILIIILAAFSFDQINSFFIVPALFCSIPNFLFGLAERRSRYHAVKENKSQQQIEQLATIAERERIARDLHDLLGHSLSTIALKAELAEKLGEAGEIEQSLTEISQVAQITRATLSEVRQAVSGYKTKDFTSELGMLIKHLHESDFTVSSSITLEKITALAESSIILIIKEAVTNILRHSSGNKVKLSNTQTEDSLTIIIHNDGKNYQATKGNGLKGIEERVIALGGSLLLDTSKGFTLTIHFDNKVFI
jgi:two-component system sensor histidine kinase DesK